MKRKNILYTSLHRFIIFIHDFTNLGVTIVEKMCQVNFFL